jgi:hypothetical protein
MKVVIIFVIIVGLVMSSKSARIVFKGGDGGRGGDAIGEGSQGGRGGAGSSIVFEGAFNPDDIKIVQAGAPGEPGQGSNGGQPGEGGQAGGVWINGKKVH